MWTKWFQHAVVNILFTLFDNMMDVMKFLVEFKVPVTLPASSGSALLCRRSFATSRFPYLAATCRGVNPFCEEEREIFVSLEFLAIVTFQM